MTLQQLRYVIAVAEAGSLSRASEMLYVAQPSLTSSVKELEKELGISVFHRSGKGMTLTNEGSDFLLHAKAVYHQYEELLEKYGNRQALKSKFGVSAQHYSFAVKAFVQMVQSFDTSKYEFAIRETETKNVIEDVSTLKSEIGILYLSDFNRQILQKIFRSNDLEFHKLVSCRMYVYICSCHPLAKKKIISFEDLRDYPCCSFEQNGNGSFYFAEDVLSTTDYSRTIKVCDRATMLNLMVGLDGYTICSGIICEELNGPDYVAVPLQTDGDDTMEIGYILKKSTRQSEICGQYIEELKKYLKV